MPGPSSRARRPRCRTRRRAGGAGRGPRGSRRRGSCAGSRPSGGSRRVRARSGAPPPSARRRAALSGGDLARGGPEQGHPLADEVARGERLRLRMQGGPNAAAAPVAEHHDVPDLEALHRELERGGGGLVATVRIVGRDQVGDVADDEDLARRGVEDGLRRRPRIAAGNDHDLGRLPVLGERTVARALGLVSVVPEGAVAVEKRAREIARASTWGSDRHRSSFVHSAGRRQILAPLSVNLSPAPPRPARPPRARRFAQAWSGRGCGRGSRARPHSGREERERGHGKSSSRGVRSRPTAGTIAAPQWTDTKESRHGPDRGRRARRAHPDPRGGR